jgi:hypothetical protein
MALSLHFSISASPTWTAGELEQFLRSIEPEVIRMGFAPTLVLNAAFDTEERRTFARRLTSGLYIEDARLAGVVVPASGQMWDHNPVAGSCRIIPSQAVLLVVTNEAKAECSFGFFRYPESLLDLNGKVIASTGLTGKWIQRDFIDSPDPRYRKIIRHFADRNFLESAKDEYA